MEINAKIKSAEGFFGNRFKVGVEIVALTIFLIERCPPRTKLDGQNDYVSRQHRIHIDALFVSNVVFITQQDGKTNRIAFRHIDRNV